MSLLKLASFRASFRTTFYDNCIKLKGDLNWFASQQRNAQLEITDHRKFNSAVESKVDLKESPQKKKVDIGAEDGEKPLVSSLGTTTDLKALTESLKNVSRFAKNTDGDLIAAEKLGIFSFFRRFYTI